MTGQAVILIPSYRPDDKLVRTLTGIRQLSRLPIVLVDDGNPGREAQNLFLSLARLEQVHIVRHAVNKGKGAALKTGFRYIQTQFPDSPGLVTADADGQHAPADIVRVAEELARQPDSLILGSRDFSGQTIPFRSRFGNQVTAKIFRLGTGISCPDTQTGLRGIPRSELAPALRVKGERFDYEMNHLLAMARRRIRFVQVPIATIYIDDNASSHYNPVLDSLKILAAIFRFMLASSIGTVVDISLFFLLSRYIFTDGAAGIIWATVLARLLSGLVNYQLVARWVFGSRPSQQSLLRYGLLFIGIMMASALSVSLLNQLVGHRLLVKLAVDSCLFLVSYKVQQQLIFRPRKPAAEEEAFLLDAYSKAG